MTICELFPYTLNYFILDEMQADDVINFAVLLTKKGKNTAGDTAQPEVHETKKKVYADQVNWY